jgi:hypothetical protein
MHQVDVRYTEPLVREVWAFPRFWLFLLSSWSFVTLPLEGVGEDVQASIRSKVEVG